jgi:hypothetical protein
VPVVIKSLIFPASAGLGRDWETAAQSLPPLVPAEAHGR